jgi:hypothetical protein
MTNMENKMRIPDVTLLQKISATADLVNMYADDAASDIETAAYRIDPEAPPTRVDFPIDEAAYYEHQIRFADDSYRSALDFIAQMDKELATLLRLRGELAEMTGIPMFSHIGEDQRFPDRAKYEV